MIDYVVPDQNKFDQYNCYQYNCSICDETFKSKNDFEEHTNVCQCASITDCCCSCHKEKNKRKKVKNYTIQTYKPHRFFKPQKDLDEHNNTHQNQEIDQYNCSPCDETFKSKNDFEEHTNVCQCASITDCCCSCQKEKIERKKVKDYTIQTYKDIKHISFLNIQKTYKQHRSFKAQKDLDEHNDTHHNQGNKNRHAGLTNWQNFSRCLLCGATDPHSHRPGVFRNRLEALEIDKGQLILNVLLVSSNLPKKPMEFSPGFLP